MRKSNLNSFLFVVLWLCNTVTAQTLAPEGIKIPLQGMDDLVFAYPLLLDGEQKEISKIYDKSVTDNGNRAVVKYEGGHEVIFTKKSGGLIELSVKNPPPGLTNFRFLCMIPFAMNEGGLFSFNNEPAKPFPTDKPAKPQIYSGGTQIMRLTAPSGAILGLSGLQPGTYFQLQDNREWNWSIFQVMFLCPYNKDHAATELRFTLGKDAEMQIKKMVDKFGQDFSKDFTGKIQSEDELKQDIQADETYYASFPKKKDLDRYGGFAGTGQTLNLKKTGFFHVQKANDQWFLVNPEGNAFFHLAHCGFGPSNDYTYTENRGDLFEWLPPREGQFASAWYPEGWWSDKAFSFYLANVIRKYGKPFEREEWTSRMIDRVRALGFTSAGAFSATPKAFTEKNFPHVRSFGFWGLGFDIPGAREFFDAFDPAVAVKIDENFAKNVAPVANDPLIIGYYLSNEQGVENLHKALPALSGKFAAKKELVQFLQKKYSNIEAFNTAWGMKMKSFEDLLESGLPVSTRAASEDVTAFTSIFLEQYYSLLHSLFRKYDKNHMLLGSRWQPGTANNEMLVNICAKYCDVISVNYYTIAFDQSFLDRIAKWSGDKPMLLSEWHYSCSAESGLPGGLGSVNTQQERGLAYRNYVEQAAATGYVVGIEWFTLIDQARAGRYFERNTGEKANTGFFSVTDRPWKGLADAAAKTNTEIHDVLFKKRPPFQWDDPRFVPKSKGDARQTISVPWVANAMKIDGSRDDFPVVPPMLMGKDQMTHGADAGDFLVAFRLAWDEKNLYFFADVTDKTPGKSERKGADLWQGDGVELFLGTEDQDRPGNLMFSDRQILLGAGQGADQIFVRNFPSNRKHDIQRTVVQKADGSGYSLEAAIPFEVLDWKPKDGAVLMFDVAVDDSENGLDRVRQFVWHGDDRVSGERGCWGRIQLVK